MKRYWNIWILALVTLCALTACRDQDEIYQEFVSKGGKRYPQITENVIGKTGYYRAFLTWLKPIDPSVTKTVVNWREGLDQKEVVISGADYPFTQADTVGIFIDDLDEQDYTFFLYTEDAEGNRSVQQDIGVTVRGDIFLETLSDRTISSSTVDSDENCVITWGGKTANLSATEVRYQSTAGEKTVRIPASQAQTVLKDYDFEAAKPYSYRSVFANDSWCEEFFKPWIEGESFKK